MKTYKHNHFIQLFFFGNYYCALCAIALSIESSIQQHYPFPDLIFIALAFSATIIFYSRAYIRTEVSSITSNLRAMWYSQNRKLVDLTQIFFLMVLLSCLAFIMANHFHMILSMSVLEWCLILVFPLIAALYYGVDNKVLGKRNLRNVLWLKPLIIGSSWAGLVTVYPVLYYSILRGEHFVLTTTGCFLFLKNLIFISILSILFDIKDYAMDYNEQLKTVVVKLGLRKTLFYIIFPLCIAGSASFFFQSRYVDSSLTGNQINTIPFLAAIAVTYSMYSRRDIFYYLMIVDGLLLVKAFCGITATIYF